MNGIECLNTSCKRIDQWGNFGFEVLDKGWKKMNQKTRSQTKEKKWKKNRSMYQYTSNQT